MLKGILEVPVSSEYKLEIYVDGNGESNIAPPHLGKFTHIPQSNPEQEPFRVNQSYFDTIHTEVL